MNSFLSILSISAFFSSSTGINAASASQPASIDQTHPIRAIVYSLGMLILSIAVSLNPCITSMVVVTKLRCGINVKRSSRVIAPLQGDATSSDGIFIISRKYKKVAYYQQMSTYRIIRSHNQNSEDSGENKQETMTDVDRERSACMINSNGCSPRAISKSTSHCS